MLRRPSPAVAAVFLPLLWIDTTVDRRPAVFVAEFAIVATLIITKCPTPTPQLPNAPSALPPVVVGGLLACGCGGGSDRDRGATSSSDAWYLLRSARTSLSPSVRGSNVNAAGGPWVARHSGQTTPVM